MGLGRNEKYHLSCTYKGREADCPKQCSKCAISIKLDGDIALSDNRLDDAIKQYKKALFVDPKFAEAWYKLGYVFSIRTEYNNALSAFNKALAIDPQYGKAMFGKALALRNIGKLDTAMALANEILDLYDDADVQNFKSELKLAGVRDPAELHSLQQAINTMTDKAYEMAKANDLLDKDGKIHTIQAIDRKEDFARKIYSFCKKRYSSLGNDKVWSESMLAAFYGSIYVALKYYQIPNDFCNIDPYDYLCNNVSLEELDRNAEKMLRIRGDKNQSEKVWNIIYLFVCFCTPILRGLETTSDLDAAVQDATESAYLMGMLLSMRYHEKEEAKNHHSPHINTAMKVNNGNEMNSTIDSPREKKALYEYKLMERVDFDLDTAISNPNPDYHDYCRIIAESESYQFYCYGANSDYSGGYVIRRSKANQDEKIFFGENYQMACVFHQYLILCDHSGKRGRFFIHARNIITGFERKHDWLGQGDLYVVINGFGRFFVQDTIKDLSLQGDRVIFHVQRKKSNHNAPIDNFNIDTEYTIVVTLVNRKLRAVAFFNSDNDVPIEFPLNDNEFPKYEKKTTLTPKELNPHWLGRNEARHIACQYKGREYECPRQCSFCAIPIKNNADKALLSGSIDDAISLYERAVTIEPKFAEAWANLGYAYLFKGNYELSLHAFKRSIAIDIRFGYALYGSAEVLKLMDRTTESLEQARLINILYPNDEKVVKFIKECEAMISEPKKSTTEVIPNKSQ